MRVVIFGGAGFLGSHVADAFTGAGKEVVIFDIKKSAYLMPAQKMITGDILNEKQVFSVVDGADVVYNFAGIADIGNAAKNPVDTGKCNILGNTFILEACKKFKVKRFVYASSLYVYSKMGSFYRSSKQACELIIENYSEVFNLSYTIIRYGSLYGPRADENNFIYRILKQAFTSGKIIRQGDGQELREYISVYDAARASCNILSPEYANQYVIIAGNQQMKVKDLLVMIKEIFDNKIKIEYNTHAVNTSNYEISPYTFSPKLATRIVIRDYIDLGKGILELIKEMYQDLNSSHIVHGLVVNSKPLDSGKK